MERYAFRLSSQKIICGIASRFGLVCNMLLLGRTCWRHARINPVACGFYIVWGCYWSRAVRCHYLRLVRTAEIRFINLTAQAVCQIGRCVFGYDHSISISGNR